MRGCGCGGCGTLLLGGLLMVAAFGILFITTMDIPAIKENPSYINFQNTLFCNAGETYIETLGATTFQGTRNMGRQFNAYCENDGERREITPTAFAAKAGAFAIPFVCGLCLFILAPMLMIGGIVRGGMRAVTSGVQVRVQEVDATGGRQSPRLSTKLAELEEAYNQGQLSESEYRRARQRLLDATENES